jgi:beta-ribofuranosylaminobenzene 5'-phosphate synthase
MIRVRTPSRLHFGLFSLPTADTGPWLNQEGLPSLPRRRFGGVGLMIDEPGIKLTLDKAQSWSAHGPLAERALLFAQRYCNAVGINDAFQIQVQAAAPEHVGLGTGTQLGLAVASAIAMFYEQPLEQQFTETLAQKIGRGARSGVGIQGFRFGGIIVEAGKRLETDDSTCVFHLNFPEDWKILVIIPHGIQGTHGVPEVEAFAQLSSHTVHDRVTESLARIVLLGMLPAIFEDDLDTFGEAVYDFNRRVGKMFERVQTGIYAHPRVEKLVSQLREMGIKGAGQSSWGPAVFGIVRSDCAAELAKRLVTEGAVRQEEILVTSACDYGAKVRRKQ